ncbi:MAG: hypothetical protein DRO62_03335 [Candidatus Altiarchaeales archaeon]|nr:MAG: hypothetical protein DRO62_03335 [Candidatus Altiarchaeales archaeon]
MADQIVDTIRGDSYLEEINKNFDLIFRAFEDMNKKMGEEENRRVALEDRVMILEGAIKNNKKRVDNITDIMRDIMRDMNSLSDNKDIKREIEEIKEDIWSLRHEGSNMSAELEKLGSAHLEQMKRIKDKITNNQIRPITQFNGRGPLRKGLQKQSVLMPLTKGERDIISIDYKIKDTKNIRTDLHVLMDLIRENKDMKVSEAARELGVDERLILKFVKILEQKNLIKFNRKIMGEPVISIAEGSAI